MISLKSYNEKLNENYKINDSLQKYWNNDIGRTFLVTLPILHDELKS